MTYKDFTAGDIFTADDADLLLRQGLIVVADAAERDAIPGPAEGMRVYRLDTHRVNIYDGLEWRGEWTNLAAGVDWCVAGDGTSVEIRVDVSGTFGSGNIHLSDPFAIPARWRVGGGGVTFGLSFLSPQNQGIIYIDGDGLVRQLVGVTGSTRIRGRIRYEIG